MKKSKNMNNGGGSGCIEGDGYAVDLNPVSIITREGRGIGGGSSD